MEIHKIWTDVNCFKWFLHSSSKKNMVIYIYIVVNCIVTFQWGRGTPLLQRPFAQCKQAGKERQNVWKWHQKWLSSLNQPTIWCITSIKLILGGRMICNPLSNMQMAVFVWGGWGKMEAGRERESERGWKKRRIRCNWLGYYPPLWA